MSLLYVIGTLILYILFMLIKKSDKKQSIFFWGVMGIILLLGLNIFIGQVLGMLKVNYNLNTYTGIYVVLSLIMFIRLFKTKEFQKYEVKKYEVTLFIFLIALVLVIVFKERDFFSGAMKYGVTDSAIHYKAAKHFSQYFDLLVNIEDKTAYDFNYMQTGAYITDGIFMKVIRDLFDMKDYYIYNVYETLIFTLNGLLFICLIKDFVDSKFSIFISHVLIILYMYGFTYESYLMGFCYLSLGLCFILGILNVLKYYFEKDENKERCNNFNNKWMVLFLGILSFGLIFSYSLFVPAVFSTVVIIFFVRGIIEKKKRFLKIVDYETLIVFIMLLVIAIVGAIYLLIPTYLDPDVEELGSAIANYGYVPELMLADYIYYIPFIIMFIVYSIKYKENLEVSIFSIIATIFTIVMYILNSNKIVSDYYLSKVYFYDWILIFFMNIYGVCKIKNINLKRLVPAYTIGFCLLILAGMFVNTNQLLFNRKALNTAGMYYYENCHRRAFVDRRYTFTTDEIELAEYVKNIEDMTVDNTLIIAKNNYHIYWVWSIADFKESKDPTNLFVNFAADYKNAVEKDEKYKYVIILEDEVPQKEYSLIFETVFENSDAVLMKRK